MNFAYDRLYHPHAPFDHIAQILSPLGTRPQFNALTAALPCQYSKRDETQAQLTLATCTSALVWNTIAPFQLAHRYLWVQGRPSVYPDIGAMGRGEADEIRHIL
jgi:hypothetical protein